MGRLAGFESRRRRGGEECKLLRSLLQGLGKEGLCVIIETRRLSGIWGNFYARHPQRMLEINSTLRRLSG